MSVSAADQSHLKHALRLARRGRFGAAPNPMVGAVLVRDGEVVGEGYHAEVGGPHAEVAALRQAGERARGGTLYVTLEPCSHHGRTPPCADAVIAAGIRRVVACHGDPDRRVRGRGFTKLRDAGIEVESGLLAAEAAMLNLRYLTPKLHGRPAVTLKWAMSLDGRIATTTGESQWITSPPARRWALELRETHAAILVGSGTALADDPRLTRRLGKAQGPILRIVLDRRLRLPPEARMLREAGPVLIYTASSSRCRRQELEERGAEVVTLPEVTPGAVLADLQERGYDSVLVEGGGEIHAAFLDDGAFDRVSLAVAPKLIGGATAPGPVAGPGGVPLADVRRLEELSCRRRGVDWILSGARLGCSQALLSKLEP